MMFSLEKPSQYTDIPRISGMMKEYSSRAVFDKMELCFVEKKLLLLHRSSSYEMAEQRLSLNLLKWGWA